MMQATSASALAKDKPSKADTKRSEAKAELQRRRSQARTSAGTPNEERV